jgi:hypothetical protein
MGLGRTIVGTALSTDMSQSREVTTLIEGWHQIELFQRFQAKVKSRQIQKQT